VVLQPCGICGLRAGFFFILLGKILTGFHFFFGMQILTGTMEDVQSSLLHKTRQAIIYLMMSKA
jgi:hypothetical protein